MTDMDESLPGVVDKLRAGQDMSQLEATAARLWLDHGGDEHDEDGSLRRAVSEFWRSQPGGDPYWDFLGTRGSCVACFETYKLENLSLCPNCLKMYCYRHNVGCGCGHRPLG